jgi:hypothetical protein
MELAADGRVGVEVGRGRRAARARSVSGWNGSALGFLVKTSFYIIWPIRLRVESYKAQGLFCKYVQNESPTGIFGLR